MAKSADLIEHRAPRQGAPILPAVLGPLALASVAFALYLISDRLGSIGPLDRASFGWLVVVPLWVAVPVVAALLWARHGRRGSVLPSVVVGCSIAAIAASLLAQGLDSTTCGYGGVRTTAETLVGSLAVGAVIGGGPAAGGLLGSFLIRRGHAAPGVLTAGAVGLLSIFAAVMVATGLLLAAGCQRPPVG